MKSKKVKSKLGKQNESQKCECRKSEKMSRILIIQKPGTQIQLSTECPSEDMDYLIERAEKILARDILCKDVNDG